jgi:hypothetical protein
MGGSDAKNEPHQNSHPVRTKDPFGLFLGLERSEKFK